MVVGPLFSLKTILVAFVMYLVLLSLQCLCSTVCDGGTSVFSESNTSWFCHVLSPFIFAVPL